VSPKKRPTERPAAFYVCLNADKGASLAYGNLGKVQTLMTLRFGPIVAAVQVSEEVAQGLAQAGWTVYECEAKAPRWQNDVAEE